MPKANCRPLRASLVTVLLAGCAVPALAQDAPIVQPGAPGQASRTLSASDAASVAAARYTPADIRFMQGMIPHHYQAVLMANLVAERTNRPELIAIAERIRGSQADEITFMQQWLRDRGADAPDPAGPHAMHHGGAHGGHDMGNGHTPLMAGMATPEQMAQLATLSGTPFDRMFLELMIPHHRGAITMVEALYDQQGSATDPYLFEFANDVVNEQQAEIGRMAALLAGLSSDPRAGLSAGFRDAGSAISNLELVASLPKPTGFFDPENPAGLRQRKPANLAETPGGEPGFVERGGLLSFANTDMAFAGNVMVAGNYHGFNVYDIAGAGAPRLISSVVCPGGQGDVSIVGDLLIMSVEQTRGRLDCGLQGVEEDVSAERFRGIRIFDVSDFTRPRQVGAVQTCRGSHTHSVVSGPGEDGVITVYVSGTASVRSGEELAGCVGEVPGDQRTALFRIDVVEIPVADPARARIVASPAVFADPATGELAGLWRGGDHGEGTQDTARTDHCHDITVFPSRDLAAGACSGNGIIFDISDPRAPKRLDVVTDPGFAYWHSATFNNDGTKVLFTDEWGGGGRPRCRSYDPRTWGADAIYDISAANQLEFGSYFKLPAPQSEQENCVAHNGAIVPVPGRDIFIQAWYQGGLSLIDFTDSANPVEIGYFDRGPIDADQMAMGGYWSAYWYDGRIYGTEIARGIDVFALKPSAHLTANEIAAAKLADQGRVFNPQQQFPVNWPADPVVAKAFLDQLERTDSLSASMRAALDEALDAAALRLGAGNTDSGLSDRLAALAGQLPPADGGDAVARRLAGLAETLNGIAARLR